MTVFILVVSVPVVGSVTPLIADAARQRQWKEGSEFLFGGPITEQGPHVIHLTMAVTRIATTSVGSLHDN